MNGLRAILVLRLFLTFLVPRNALVGASDGLSFGCTFLLLAFLHQFVISNHLTDKPLDLTLRLFPKFCHYDLRSLEPCCPVYNSLSLLMNTAPVSAAPTANIVVKVVTKTQIVEFP